MAVSCKLAEYTYNLITAKIKADIASALTDIRTDRADKKVEITPPQSYFSYAPVEGFRLPAIITLVEETDMRNANGANSINALDRVIVSCICEDRTQEYLTIKAWRYQAALCKVLHEASLTSADSKVKLVVKVTRMAFGPELTKAQDPNTPDGVFRKEVVFELDVEHWENL